jgi:hypothetical protein
MRRSPTDRFTANLPLSICGVTPSIAMRGPSSIDERSTSLEGELKLRFRLSARSCFVSEVAIPTFAGIQNEKDRKRHAYPERETHASRFISMRRAAGRRSDRGAKAQTASVSGGDDQIV